MNNKEMAKKIEIKKKLFMSKLKAAVNLAGGSSENISEYKIEELYELLLPNGIELCFELKNFNREYY